MDVTFTIVSPIGKNLAEDLVARLREILLRLQVAFVLEEASDDHAMLRLIDTTEAEQRLVIRLLQRAGYHIDIEVP